MTIQLPLLVADVLVVKHGGALQRSKLIRISLKRKKKKFNMMVLMFFSPVESDKETGQKDTKKMTHAGNIKLCIG